MTYSIIARDPVSGDLGAATQTRYLAVGATVPWARPGTGVVVTQALTEPAHGPRLLDLLASGTPARAALEAVLAADPSPGFRQVGLIDAAGSIAVHTGERCIQFAGHVVEQNHAAVANIAREPGLPEAMSRAFASAAGSLARRLAAGLQAGDEQGGDLRGRQSAALLVVSGDPADPPWSTRVDLRVDDHTDPVREITRLLTIQEAYGQLSLGINLLFAEAAEASLTHFAAAAELAPDNPQIAFWHAFAAETSGHPVPRTTPDDPRWAELRRRLGELGLPGPS